MSFEYLFHLEFNSIKVLELYFYISIFGIIVQIQLIFKYFSTIHLFIKPQYPLRLFIDKNYYYTSVKKVKIKFNYGTN